MLELDAAQFMRLLQILDNSDDTARANPGVIPELLRGMVCETPADALKELCDKLDLPVSSTSTTYVRKSRNGNELSESFRFVKRTIHSELVSRLFLEPDTKYRGYFKRPKLFGDEVFDAFPSANEDISEAGNCLALERSTACVMHLMRVCECGLAVLAAAVSVPKKNDWGSYLREIERELSSRTKSSGARSADEQFYAEAAASFDFVRRAWRNPTLHIDRSYSMERAEEILQAVRSFMRHLATRLKE